MNSSLVLRFSPLATMCIPYQVFGLALCVAYDWGVDSTALLLLVARGGLEDVALLPREVPGPDGA